MVSPLRSQALYHGLAECMDDRAADTVVLCQPAAPHFCVGYHQRADQVLDLHLCRRRGWPVLRRKIGGGAVYLDAGQLFYQAIVHRSRAPWAVSDIYAAYLAGPVLALRRLGLDAALLPPNEIEVAGRRIAGTGGGFVGEAVVVVGNVLLDFPDHRMAAAWRAPSAPFRRLARDGLRRHLTTLGRALPGAPPVEEVTRALAGAFGETLGRPLVAGALAPHEAEAVARAETWLASEAFALGGGGRPGGGLKISRGVFVFEGGAPGVRVSVRVRDGVVDGLSARGAGAARASRLLGRRLAEIAGESGDANPADLVGALLLGAERRP